MPVRSSAPIALRYSASIRAWAHTKLIRQIVLTVTGTELKSSNASRVRKVGVNDVGMTTEQQGLHLCKGSPAATRDAAGVNLLRDLSEVASAAIADRVVQVRRPEDIVVISIHWGPNWGYRIPEQQRRLAHRAIDKTDVSIVHGHSSHHAKAIDPRSSDLVALELVPLQIKRFQLDRVASEDVNWLQQTLDRESRPFGARVGIAPEGKLAVCLGRMSARLPSTKFPQQWQIPPVVSAATAGLFADPVSAKLPSRAEACHWH